MDVDQTLDVVVQTTSFDLDSHRNPIRKRIDLADDLYIDLLPTVSAQKIFKACEPKGYCFDPNLQFGQMYSFVGKILQTEITSTGMKINVYSFALFYQS